MSFYNKTTATNFNNLRSVYMVIFFPPLISQKSLYRITDNPLLTPYIYFAASCKLLRWRNWSYKRLYLRRGVELYEELCEGA